MHKSQNKKTSALRLSEIHIYLLQTKASVMELMEHLFKAIGLPHEIYLIEGAFSPDVIWSSVYQTAQHQFARASLIFAHDPKWRESSTKQFGLPNGKRL